MTPVKSNAHSNEETPLKWTPVPADGLCLSHVAVAARDPEAWMQGRDAHGWARDVEQEKADHAEARAILAAVIAEMERDGKVLEAARLRLAGPSGYPGMDELKYFAKTLGGRITMRHLDHADAPIIEYGDEGNLLYCVGHRKISGLDGAQADHWVLVQSNMPKTKLHQTLPHIEALPPTPKEGQTIMQVKRTWLDLILSKSKVLEIRGLRKRAGTYYLGCEGQVYGVVTTLDAVPIRTVDHFKALTPLHKVSIENALPYKKTFALPLTSVQKMSEPIQYVAHHGAIGWVRYEARGAQAETAAAVRKGKALVLPSEITEDMKIDGPLYGILQQAMEAWDPDKRRSTMATLAMWQENIEGPYSKSPNAPKIQSLLKNIPLKIQETTPLGIIREAMESRKRLRRKDAVQIANNIGSILEKLQCVLTNKHMEQNSGADGQATFQCPDRWILDIEF